MVKKLPEMVVVLLQGVAVVVEVGEHEGQVLEQPVHEALEVLGGVAQTERPEVGVAPMSSSRRYSAT
jgi:hypothetical protein